MTYTLTTEQANRINEVRKHLEDLYGESLVIKQSVTFSNNYLAKTWVQVVFDYIDLYGVKQKYSYGFWNT